MNEFQFNTKLDQTILLGRKARNIAELLDGIMSVPESSIYHHTHRYLQQHHYLSPEPPNDFAYWITEVINDVHMGELLSSLDIIQFNNLGDLREQFIDVIQGHLQSSERVRDCPPGEEFHFMASRTFVLRTPYAAHNLAEFMEVLKQISVSSLYYHIFDAKLRLEKGENDFSKWFRDSGLVTLADEVARLDPYRYTLEGLRKRILSLGDKYD
ncbi:MAG: hypothetical protein HW412_560 [Bacteroidetes bacterium]|nr:hypothetical protein [Bacteroidota bacterium]